MSARFPGRLPGPLGLAQQQQLRDQQEQAAAQAVRDREAMAVARLQRLEGTLGALRQAIDDCGIGRVRDTSKDMTDSQLSGVGNTPLATTTEFGPRATDTNGRVEVLKANCPGRSLGWASVHVTEESTSFLEAAHTQRLVLQVDWKTKRGGGQALMDCTRGTLFSLPALETINIYAKIARSNEFGGFTAGPTKRVEACVHWGTSISPKAVYFTSESQSLLAGVDGAAILIPECARSFICMSTTPATLGNLTAHMQTGAGGGRIWGTLNPNANGTPVAHGADFLTLNSTTDAIITVVWELWL